MENKKPESKPIQIPKENGKISFPDIEKSREYLKKMFGLSKTPEGGLYADKHL
jgi:hypothetical protein